MSLFLRNSKGIGDGTYEEEKYEWSKRRRR